MTEHPSIELTDRHVLHVDDHSVVIDKEPGWPVHATRDPNRPHLEGAVARWLGADPAESPVVVHRLDVWTSGVILLARTINARRRFATMFEQREMTKVYEAICVGGPADDDGALKHYLAKRRERGRDVMVPVRSGGKVAITAFRVLGRGHDRPGRALTCMHLEPKTGRTHQLRAQTAAAGWPIFGDRLYGGASAEASGRDSGGPGHGGQLLHARRLTYIDPFDGVPRTITAPRPSSWDQVLVAAGIDLAS